MSLDLPGLLATLRSIAIVGISADPRRPSRDVAAYLVRCGYACVGVNPGLAGREVAGMAVVASLAEPPRVVWMQLGVIDAAAKERAEAAGLIVVMDRCPKIELG